MGMFIDRLMVARSTRPKTMSLLPYAISGYDLGRITAGMTQLQPTIPRTWRSLFYKRYRIVFRRAPCSIDRERYASAGDDARVSVVGDEVRNFSFCTKLAKVSYIPTKRRKFPPNIFSCRSSLTPRSVKCFRSRATAAVRWRRHRPRRCCRCRRAGGPRRRSPRYTVL